MPFVLCLPMCSTTAAPHTNCVAQGSAFLTLKDYVETKQYGRVPSTTRQGPLAIPSYPIYKGTVFSKKTVVLFFLPTMYEKNYWSR